MTSDLSHLSDGELETKFDQLRDAFRYAKGDLRDKAQRELNDCRAERDRRLPEVAA